MKKLAVVITTFLALSASLCAQSRETEIFFAGGHSVSGGRGDTSVEQAGLRLGWRILPTPKVNLEYSIDFIPLFLVQQPQNNSYGVSFTPFNLKLNVTAVKWHPYAELGGGVLFTNNNVPFGTSKVNFTPQTGVGVQIPIRGSRNFLDLGLKYVHISNAGLTTPNPGINTIQFKIGLGRWGGLTPLP